MGCKICSNKSEIKLDNSFEKLDKTTIQRNLNYLLNNESKLGNKIILFDSKSSSNQGNTNHLENNLEESSYLETMRESMFNEINLMRKNPRIIIEKINKYSPFISTSKKNCFIQVDNHNKIKLNKGKSIFDSCKSFILNKKPLPEFILKNELTFPFPSHDFEYIDIENHDFINKNYISLTLQKIQNQLMYQNIELVNFHYDIMNSNIELSVILQIVDDTNSCFQRRNNILNKYSKYIGINIGKMKNGLYCYYLLFGKDKNTLNNN